MARFPISETEILTQCQETTDRQRISVGGSPSPSGGPVGLLTALAILEKVRNAPPRLEPPGNQHTPQAPQQGEGTPNDTEAATS